MTQNNFRPQDRRNKINGYLEYRCPICKGWHFNIKSHITLMAKKEAFKLVLGEITNTPHLELYKKYTLKSTMTANRNWKN